jgi:hypothetical protein
MSAMFRAVAWLALVGGCSFDADYGGGVYTCSDGACPSGLVCDRANNRCVASLPPDDAPAGGDGGIDARVPALTCVDPGLLGPTGGTASGTTVGRTSTVAAMCGGFVMTGADAVYRFTPGAGEQFLIEITGVDAYVIAPCSASPATPTCLGNAFARPGNPISITTAFAGEHFVVVDHDNAATTAAYTLTVTPQ